MFLYGFLISKSKSIKNAVVCIPSKINQCELKKTMLCPNELVLTCIIPYQLKITEEKIKKKIILKHSQIFVNLRCSNNIFY